MAQVEKLFIFLASPGNVPKERRYVHEAVKDLNDTVASSKDVILHVESWENSTYPGYGMDAQALINAQIAEMAKYSLFVGIMWNRLGTPTPRADSGTVEEFERAAAALAQQGQPDIWFYFRRSPARWDSEEQVEQSKKVLSFRERLQANGLSSDYKSPSDFQKKFRNHLIMWLEAKTNREPEKQIETRRITQEKYLSDELLLQKYINVCEGEDIFIEFCKDVIVKGDFLKNVPKSLRAGIIEYDKARRIIENLSYVFQLRDVGLLFELVCLTYDKIKISNEAIKRMVVCGLSNEQIINACNHIPCEASVYLCRVIFNAFYNHGISPLRFEGALMSPAFTKYCLNLDFDRMWEIVESWKQDFDYPASIYDTVACILYMIEHAETRHVRNQVRVRLKLWYESGVFTKLKSDVKLKVKQAINNYY